MVNPIIPVKNVVPAIPVVLVAPVGVINPIECLCPKSPIPKQGISFGGNLNIPGHSETQAFRTSYQLMLSSTTRNGSKTKFYNVQQIRSCQSPQRNTFG